MRTWEEFLLKQDKVFGKETVDKWLRSLKMLRFDARNIYFEAKDSFQIHWFKEYVQPKLPSTILKNIHIHFELKEQKEKQSFFEKRAQEIKSDSLDPEEKFIPSSKNELPHKLLLQSVKENTPLFNPIFLYGPPSSGKTHLMRETARSFEKKGMRVFYVRAQTFTSHVVGAIQLGNMQTFRKCYRKIDALLVDDIQILAKKSATQEEFFHTFNALHTEGKQIILSANVAPKDLSYIEPRLISRFEWGICLSLSKYDRSDLETILQKKAENYRFHLSHEVLSFLLDSFHSSSIFLAFEALVLRMKTNAEDIFTVKNVLKDLLQKEGKAHITPDYVIKSVAEHYKISPQEILGKSQTREASIPRKVAMYLLRNKLQLSFLKIADIFQRDHSTVMTAVRSVKNDEDNILKIFESLEFKKG